MGNEEDCKSWLKLSERVNSFLFVCDRNTTHNNGRTSAQTKEDQLPNRQRIKSTKKACAKAVICITYESQPAGSPSRPSRGKQARAYVLGETDMQEALGRELAQWDGSGGIKSTPRSQRTVAEEEEEEEEEPELPTTPSQRGLEELDGPRRGVLFSSPSKRPPRAKDPVKQSPLRPKAPPVQVTSPAHHLEDGPVDAKMNPRPKKMEPLDLEVEKRKQEKAKLERELAELEVQVTRCTEEIVKEQQRGPTEALRSADRTDLQDFITKVSGANADVEAALPVSSLLCSFLPFSTMPIRQPRSKVPEKPVPSHQPVELADPLPYLEMFTSFKVTTQLGLSRGKILPSSKRVHQKHTIDIVGPQKLLTAQISVVIDTLANEIIDMHILRLSPWAERELGTFLRKRAEQRDLGNACWAIESYWNIAQKRAQHWHRAEQTFSHLLAGHSSEDTENTRPKANPDTKISRRDLNRHLGRDSLILQDKHVLLKLNWRIGFDWTGEAESQVTVEPAFPSVWTEADAAKTFSKVPETFASLLQSRGAFEATRVMTALLFGQ
ncbi:hypothetical protein SNOG_08137 [Parastagonospora nodorum SN15]|uniref:Uncharacterized protein n=1 Tax=Phaeosphaeria nodorum (strain SN15 / ATCC MYA-4574 / FGSC 10173) TaxID=321614 RepID=Q0UJC7_PHANO|nr:hypothetical protein SNOG_08137 [Parastagonospora nodorum SN15]EAT84413.2 hypothetical protein SNOG_08137 [Parastagonospora nodorum SN15]